MATLTSQQLKDSYQSLVTIGDSITSDPTSGVLENGLGNPIDSITIYNDATGTLDSSILNLSVLSNDANTNPRASIQAQKDGTDNGRLILNTSLSGTLTERLRIRSGGDISFRDGSDNEAFYWDASAGSLGIGTTSPAVELDVNGEIRASSGILFGSDTASANALDDYEEGTWNPEFGDGTTFVAVSDTYNYYTKIGRQVTANARIVNADTSSFSSGDSIYITLPFVSDGDFYGTIYLRGAQAGFSGLQAVQINDGSDNFVLLEVTMADVNDDATDYWFTVTYFV